MDDQTQDVTLQDPDKKLCPKCGQKMLRWYTPPALSWGTPYQYVCFNDECTYYVRGWKWMKDTYNKEASYRHRLNPFTLDAGPVPVWSEKALRGRIMGDDETAEEYLLRTGGLTEEEGAPKNI